MSDAFNLFVSQYPIISACAFGIIPAVLWLWFWLKEDMHPEPTKFIIFTFLAGSLTVFGAIPMQHFAEYFFVNQIILFIIWAGVEETFKFGAAWIGGIHTTADEERVDAVIYMIIASLGFSAIENSMFLIDPFISGNISTSLITGNMRFIGATLLHIVSSSTVGIFIALSFAGTKRKKFLYTIMGLLSATGLHSLFNILIMNAVEYQTFIIFGGVWISIIALLLIFEKIKSIK